MYLSALFYDPSLRIPIMSNDQSLLDRVEMPSIPEAAMKKIAVLEEQFSRAEVEQCMFPKIS